MAAGCKHVAMYQALSLAHYQQQHYATAQAANQRALALAPHDSLLWLHAARIAWALGGAKQTCKAATRASKLGPSLHEAWYLQALGWHKQRKWQRALQCMDRAIALKATEDLYYYQRGLAHWQLGQATAACADWQRVYELDDLPDGELILQRCKDNK